ncbi:MAG TPA: glycosyltransferase family 39 protein [Ktedonobacteraceae bacterium]
MMMVTEGTTTTSQFKPQDKQPASTSFQRRLALAAIMLASIFMNFYQLGQNGFGNLFYAAGVRSMADSLHNFFFVAYDPGGFVTIDKPPLGFWLQTLSVKLFGFAPFSIFFPQALAGVLAVLVLFHLVRRHFGYGAGLLAALALALSPLSVATARNNTIDSTLVLVLLLAAWAIMLAAETGKWRWLLLSAGLVGLGFNVKMMEAYLVVPAFGLLYLLAAPRKLWLRVGQLLVATLILLAVSLSWAVVVDLTPASQRPYVGSSQNNSEVSLAFGYNGVDRLLGRFGLGGNHQQSTTTSAHQSLAGHTGGKTSTNNGDLSLSGANASSETEHGSNTNTSGQPTPGHHSDTDPPGPLRLFNRDSADKSPGCYHSLCLVY